MAPAVSKFDTVPFNCYEVGHTWNPNCQKAALQVGGGVFKEALKIYTTCYVVSLIASRRFPKGGNDVLKLVKDVLRSSLFLSLHGAGYVNFVCLLRKMMGNFNYFTMGYLPSFIASYIAIFVEKPQRRPLLALYVTNVATEVIYRMLRSRGLVRDVKHFDLALFCCSMIAIIFQMKKGSRRPDVVDSVLKKIFGAEEFTKKQGHSDVVNPREQRRVSLGGPGLRVENPANQNENTRRPRATEDTYRNRFIHFVLWMHKSVEDIACHLERMVNAVSEGHIHEMCPHNQSCFDYWMEGFYTRFLAGCGMHGLYQIFVLTKNLLAPRRPPLDKTGNLLSNSILLPCIRTGIGLGAMNLLFRLINCSFRWLKDMDGPGHAAFSGFLSCGLGFFLLKPPNSLGLYLFFKALESAISESHRNNNWKIINFIDKALGGGWCLLYSLSTALLFHVAVFEPHNMKPSYYHFLSKTTGGRMNQLNRQILDIYGSNSSLFLKDFWPKLNEAHLSVYMKQLLKMREELDHSNVAFKDLVGKFLNVS